MKKWKMNNKGTLCLPSTYFFKGDYFLRDVNIRLIFVSLYFYLNFVLLCMKRLSFQTFLFFLFDLKFRLNIKIFKYQPFMILKMNLLDQTVIMKQPDGYYCPPPNSSATHSWFPVSRTPWVYNGLCWTAKEPSCTFSEMSTHP